MKPYRIAAYLTVILYTVVFVVGMAVSTPRGEAPAIGWQELALYAFLAAAGLWAAAFAIVHSRKRR